ncbi:RNase adapter RapZ [Celeribacter sp.]|uniref:RNase adapter RapZ n=1 Tax=Celeribacter sp. TaxID=1890673 RepID=UPI003A91B5D2
MRPDAEGTSADGPIPPSAATKRVVLVTGPSGAGRSTAINVLEDLGYETIDNLPLSVLPRLLDADDTARPLALGLDVRNRDFSIAALIEVIDGLARAHDISAELLFLEASPDTLVRRYSETRRRHPLAPAESAAEGVDRERDLLVPIRSRADILIDTTDLTPHQLRDEMERWFAQGDSRQMAVLIQSFSYKRGMPRGVDTAFDVRFLANPYWDADLRGLTGMDPRVRSYVEADLRYHEFFDKVVDLTKLLLPAYEEEGKRYLAIGFGCTGGQHRSVTLAENLAKALADQDWRVSIRHRELERRGLTVATDTSGTSA